MAEVSSASFTLRAAGDYTPSDQLDNSQIEALKALFDATPGGERIQNIVIQRIVTRLMVDDALEGGFGEDEDLELLKNKRVVELIAQAAFLGSHWQQGVKRAIDLEGSEWPDFQTPPATYVAPLRHEDVISYLQNIHANNPEMDFEEQIKLFEQITGINLRATGESDG